MKKQNKVMLLSTYLKSGPRAEKPWEMQRLLIELAEVRSLTKVDA